MRLWDALAEGRGKAHNRQFQVRRVAWANFYMRGETYVVCAPYVVNPGVLRLGKFDTNTAADYATGKTEDWEPGIRKEV